MTQRDSKLKYISAYIYARDNDVKGTVYKLKKGQGSLYDAYDKYFEYLWLKYDSSTPGDSHEKWAKWQ